MTKQRPVTESDIERNNAEAEDDEYKLFQQEQDALMEAQWLESRLQIELDTDEDDFYNDDDVDFADEPLGLIRSRHDPNGIYTPDGRCIGRVRCNCEDYPCCGH